MSQSETLEVEVKEATKTGYSVARGGETLSILQSQEARREEEELEEIWQIH